MVIGALSGASGSWGGAAGRDGDGGGGERARVGGHGDQR